MRYHLQMIDSWNWNIHKYQVSAQHGKRENNEFICLDNEALSLFACLKFRLNHSTIFRVLMNRSLIALRKTVHSFTVEKRELI